MRSPTDLYYTAEHEWVALDDGTARVGVTAYATEALGDIVYVELPAVGCVVTAGDTCGELESTKAVSDLYSPVTGEVVAVNTTVDGDPSVVNRDPFGEGWLFVVRLTGESQLLNPAEYDALVEA